MRARQIFADFGHEINMALLTDKQKKESFTLRELLGLVRVCLVHLKNWSHHCVRVFVDNTALAKIMIRGSRIPYLHTRVRKLVATLATHNIRIKVIWIPRKENRGAIKYHQPIFNENNDFVKYEDMPFIKKWVKDENIRKYDNIGVYPPPNKCPSNILNIWKPFYISTLKGECFISAMINVSILP